DERPVAERASVHRPLIELQLGLPRTGQRVHAIADPLERLDIIGGHFIVKPSCKGRTHNTNVASGEKLILPMPGLLTIAARIVRPPRGERQFRPSAEKDVFAARRRGGSGTDPVCPATAANRGTLPCNRRSKKIRARGRSRVKRPPGNQLSWA